MSPDEMRARLAEIEAQKEKLAAEREARNAEARLREQLEAAEQELKDAAALAEAEAEHGPSYVHGGDEDSGNRRLAVVQTSVGAILLRRAHPNVFRRFVNAAKATEEEFFKLVRPSVLYPEKARFDAMLEEQPAILTRCANAVAEMAGARNREISGK